MLKCRSGCSSGTRLVSQHSPLAARSALMRTIVIAVGRLRPPFADDVQHYQKLLARHAKLELIELREDEKVPGRIPDDAYVVVLDSDGRTFASVELGRWLEERRMEGRDLCFVVGGPRGLDLEADLKLSFGPMT